jgi:hypothetical protein
MRLLAFRLVMTPIFPKRNKLNKLETNNFLRSTTELMSEGKPPSPKLERKVKTENHSLLEEKQAAGACIRDGKQAEIDKSHKFSLCNLYS